MFYLLLSLYTTLCFRADVIPSVDNMFSTAGNKPHSARKRMISNIYSKSVVTTSPALRAQMSVIIYDRFLPALLGTLANPEPGVLNIYQLLSASTMDIVTAYIFGLKASSNLIDDAEHCSWFLDLYNSRRSYNFWPQELPEFTETIQKWTGYRLSPKWVDEANGEIERWTMEMCEGAAGVLKQSYTKPEDMPVVYQQLLAALSKESEKAGLGEVDLNHP